MNRTEARAAAMKLVYEWDMGGDGGDETIMGILDLKPNDEEYAFMRALVESVQHNTDQIDQNIEKHAVGWKLDRLTKVDLAIMRLAVGELLIDKEPAPVIINEAVELAHTYSTDKAPAFINGVLGNLSRAGIE